MAQITLNASSSSDITVSSTPTRGMQIIEKSADQTETTVSFKLDEGGNAPSSSGPCKSLPLVIDYEYTLNSSTVITETLDGKEVKVETGNGFSKTSKSNGWLGAGACTYDSETKTYTQKINMTYNMDTQSSRAAAVVVYSPSGREVTRFVIIQGALPTPANPDKPVIDNIPITKLVASNSDAANCYIISQPGRYELPAYKGAFKAVDLGTAEKCEGTPDIIWNDNSNNQIEFFQQTLAEDKILIDIMPIKDATTGKVTGHSTGSVSNGNALVAIKDESGKILWSWHLWFWPLNSDLPTEAYPGTANNKLLDRNLGASAQGSDGGLFYQSGRKDPLKPTLNTYDIITENNLESAVNNPTSFYTKWSSTTGWDSSSKSNNDPCPPGYKVPSAEVWAKSKDSFTRLVNMNDLNFIYNELVPTIIYPYSGYVNNNGVHEEGYAGGITDKTSNRIIYSPTSASFF